DGQEGHARNFPSSERCPARTFSALGQTLAAVHGDSDRTDRPFEPHSLTDRPRPEFPPSWQPGSPCVPWNRVPKENPWNLLGTPNSRRSCSPLNRGCTARLI